MTMKTQMKKKIKIIKVKTIMMTMRKMTMMMMMMTIIIIQMILMVLHNKYSLLLIVFPFQSQVIVIHLKIKQVSFIRLFINFN